MVDVQEQEGQVDFQYLRYRASDAFTPRTPVQVPELFAGEERRREVERLVMSMMEPGAIVLFGERGVGKTSLLNFAEGIVKKHRVVIRTVGGAGETYGSMWKNALGEIIMNKEVRGIGFDATPGSSWQSFTHSIDKDSGVGDVLAVLKRLPAKIVFAFDEFDRLESDVTTTRFADTIKAITDYGLPVCIVLVGVGDDLSDLLQAHESIERSIRTVHLARMLDIELEDIVSRGMQALGMAMDNDALSWIVLVSRGLPHYTHLLAYHATISALNEKSLKVDFGHVTSGSYDALHEIEATVREHYKRATATGRKDATYKEVLTACALTSTDEQGYFRPVDVCEPLSRVLGKPATLASFSSKLSAFAKPNRDHVLTCNQRGGRPRYRFSNPLLQPYTILRGVKDGILPVDFFRNR